MAQYKEEKVNIFQATHFENIHTAKAKLYAEMAAAQKLTKQSPSKIIEQFENQNNNQGSPVSAQEYHLLVSQIKANERSIKQFQTKRKALIEDHIASIRCSANQLLKLEAQLPGLKQEASWIEYQQKKQSANDQLSALELSLFDDPPPKRDVVKQTILKIWADYDSCYTLLRQFLTYLSEQPPAKQAVSVDLKGAHIEGSPNAKIQTIIVQTDKGLKDIAQELKHVGALEEKIKEKDDALAKKNNYIAELEKKLAQAKQEPEKVDQSHPPDKYIPGPGMFNGAKKVVVVPDEKEDVNEADKQVFFRHIARGDQDEAGIMLKKTPALAFAKGKFDDLSDLRCLEQGDQFERVFQNISGWQYAVWAGDIHMCYMMKNCFATSPQSLDMVERAKVQWSEVQNGVGDFAANKYGKQFDLTPLINALNIFTKDADYDWYEGDALPDDSLQQIEGIGRLQRKLPAHVINEYCRPDRSFELSGKFIRKYSYEPPYTENPTPPDFQDLTLPRKGAIDMEEFQPDFGYEQGLDWYLSQVCRPTYGPYSGTALRADSKACFTFEIGDAGVNELMTMVKSDEIALRSLKDRRTQQINQLPQELDASVKSSMSLAM